jgi:hypothetical protein
MIVNEKKDAAAGVKIPTIFNVQVFSKDGRILSEYTLTRHQHNVSTLAAAESHAEENLLDNYGEALLVIVSEETLTKMRQTQRLVTPLNPATQESAA